MLLAVTFFGRPIVAILFGSGYSMAAEFLPWLTLAYLPWALAQGLLIRLTASGSRRALIVLLGACVAEWTAASFLLPNVQAMIAAIGGIGGITLLLFFAQHLITSKNTIEDANVSA